MLKPFTLSLAWQAFKDIGVNRAYALLLTMESRLVYCS